MNASSITRFLQCKTADYSLLHCYLLCSSFDLTIHVSQTLKCIFRCLRINLRRMMCGKVVSNSSLIKEYQSSGLKYAGSIIGTTKLHRNLNLCMTSIIVVFANWRIFSLVRLYVVPCPCYFTPGDGERAFSKSLLPKIRIRSNDCQASALTTQPCAISIGYISYI